MKKIFISFILFIATSILWGYSYSSVPLEVLGFTKNSTKAEVIQQLRNWGINYSVNTEFSDWGGDFISCHGVQCFGIDWSRIDFAFCQNNKIGSISLSIDFDNNVEWENLQSIFNNKTSSYPFRRSGTWFGSEYIYSEYIIKNGQNENESAVFHLVKMLNSNLIVCTQFCFLFVGGQKKYFDVDNW